MSKEGQEITAIVTEKLIEKTKPAAHPFAGVEVFSESDQNVVSPSNAKYIYIMLDDKDKQLLMMLMLPHIRKTLLDGGLLDPDSVDKLLEWTAPVIPNRSIDRIRRLCFFGAIVTKNGVGWVTNPKVAQEIALKA